LCRHWEPCTTTIALDLRTTVELSRYTREKILVESSAFGTEEATPPTLPLSGPLGLIFAVVGYFGVHGLRVVIEATAPVRSGMGGSGTATVATIGALAKLLARAGGRDYDRREIVLLAHHLEDSLHANTGLQDQASATYGGVHLWRWNYSDRLDFDVDSLLVDPAELESHVLAAYSGKPHTGNRSGSVLERFKRTGDLEKMRQISLHARRLGEAIRDHDYRAAGRALFEEFEVRSEMMDQIVPDEDRMLVTSARDLGCGVRFAGRGGGGSIWAIGEADAITSLSAEWTSILSRREAGFVFPRRIAREGLHVTEPTRLQAGSGTLKPR